MRPGVRLRRVGYVADGVGIDTLTVGPHDFTVTATDGVGNETEVINSYTVVADRLSGYSRYVDLILGEAPTAPRT